MQCQTLLNLTPCLKTTSGNCEIFIKRYSDTRSPNLDNFFLLIIDLLFLTSVCLIQKDYFYQVLLATVFISSSITTLKHF